MDAAHPIIVAVQDVQARKRIVTALKRREIAVEIAETAGKVLEIATNRSTALLLTDTGQPDMDYAELLRRFREGFTPETRFTIMLLHPEQRAERWQVFTEIDEILPAHFTGQDVFCRVRSGLRQLECWQELRDLRFDLARTELEAEMSRAYSEKLTEQCIEIAAQLQSEVIRNQELEVEHIRLAKADTVMQAAATLRHEINNPLFAISGSAETLLIRLRRAENNPLPSEDLLPAIERILAASDRIRQVVLGFSAVTNPGLVDYLPGISMFELVLQQRKSA